MYEALIPDLKERLKRFPADEYNPDFCRIKGAYEALVAMNEELFARQAENGSKDKEIAKLKDVNISQRRGLRQLRAALTRVEAERDAAISDVLHDCEHCNHAVENGACKLIPDGDQFSPDYTDCFDRDGNCDHWEWRGAQGEENDGV